MIETILVILKPPVVDPAQPPIRASTNKNKFFGLSCMFSNSDVLRLSIVFFRAHFIWYKKLLLLMLNISIITLEISQIKMKVWNSLFFAIFDIFLLMNDLINNVNGIELIAEKMIASHSTM